MVAFYVRGVPVGPSAGNRTEALAIATKYGLEK